MVKKRTILTDKWCGKYITCCKRTPFYVAVQSIESITVPLNDFVKP